MNKRNPNFNQRTPNFNREQINKINPNFNQIETKTRKKIKLKNREIESRVSLPRTIIEEDEIEYANRSSKTELLSSARSRDLGFYREDEEGGERRGWERRRYLVGWEEVMRR